MAGSLTLGGLAAGLQTGEKIIGPMTMTGKVVIGTILDGTLSAGDNRFAVPGEAMAVVIAAPFTAEPGEVQLRTNLNEGDSGLPVNINGFTVIPLIGGTTALILHAGATANVELTFI